METVHRWLWILMGFVIITGFAAGLSWAITPALQLIHVKECR